MNVIDLNNETWSRLQARRAQLPHALLLAGPPGLGKFALAQAFAASLLCEQQRDDGSACGVCLACRWQTQGNHPDFRLLQPEALAEDAGEGGDGKKKPSVEIKIEQVRALDDFLTVGTHRQGLRIVLVHPAEAMNRSTANSLLKVLEEPAPSTLFLLVSSEHAKLLPTIRSRCQLVPVAVPSAATARVALQHEGVVDADSWLALAGGAPFLAARLAAAGRKHWLDALIEQLAQGARGDALAAAAALDKLLRERKEGGILPQLVGWLQKWTVDLNLVAQSQGIRYFLRQRARIEPLAAATAPVRLVRFYRLLVKKRREAEQPLNARLFLEDLFLSYYALFEE
jgi:DNA polymerase III subunit delta'